VWHSTFSLNATPCFAFAHRFRENKKDESLFSKKQIYEPRAADRRICAFAVNEHGFVLTPSVTQDVSEVGHLEKIASFVDFLSEFKYVRLTPGLNAFCVKLRTGKDFTEYLAVLLIIFLN